MGDAFFVVSATGPMTSISLKSEELLTDIEHHFRITAGPGAGKTYWLANHVRHVIAKSERLTPCARVGVISYTNVAVREVLRGLGTSADGAEVSTIHSFLFRNLVRPYLHLLKTDSGEDLVAHQVVDTHSEHVIWHNNLDGWLGTYGRRQLLMQPRNLDLLKSRLRMLTVRYDDQGSAFYTPCKSDQRDVGIRDLLTPEKLLAYKQLYWARGAVDHEDVLYFGYRLLSEFPTLRKFLSARFPYLFVDEFQDTLPVQSALVRWLADEGTVVGVIGDPEQAIYGFLDASPMHFRDFQLSGYKAYEIADNRRSTGNIVEFLNRVRSDGLTQAAIRPEVGAKPTVYAGCLASALATAKVGCRDAPSMLVLARDHKGVLVARRPEQPQSGDPWDAIEGADLDRFRFLQHLAASVDLAKRQLFDVAIQRLVQGISTRNGFRAPLKYDGTVHLTTRRSLALSLLEFMIREHDAFLSAPVLDVYNALKVHVTTCIDGLKLTAVQTGRKFGTAASACKYGALVESVKSSDETRLTRTVHQAKGAEANAVFVVLQKDAIEHILQPVAGDEEHRITYVALSRARDELHIFCPDEKRLGEFEGLGATVQLTGNAQQPKSTKAGGKKRSSS